MALISSESMTLMVKGTLASEFLTRFWPTRLTYSTMTGSVTRWALFSISIEYCLPTRISQSVEYQLPRPRPPMLRVPMALTSSSLPALMCGFSSSPGEGMESVLALADAAAFFISSGVGPGAGLGRGARPMVGSGTSGLVWVVGAGVWVVGVWLGFWVPGGVAVGSCACTASAKDISAAMLRADLMGYRRSMGKLLFRRGRFPDFGRSPALP